MQSLVILSLISLNVTGIASMFNEAILMFASMNIIPTNLLFEMMFTFNTYDSEPVNDYFSKLGYSSSNAVQNMGSAYLYLLGNIALLVFVIKPLQMCNKRYAQSEGW